MNRDRILYSISLMEEAKKFDSLGMESWIEKTWSEHPESISQLHLCGSKACFAGHLMLSGGWKKAGGSAWNNIPAFPDNLGNFVRYSDAVAEFLGISKEYARQMVYGGTSSSESGLDPDEHSPFYDKVWSEVTPDDVIEKLQALLDEEVSDDDR